MDKVIVTGASGFLGSLLIQKLINKGVKVVAVSRSFDECAFPDSQLITKIETELVGLDRLEELIPRDIYDAFFHLAWQGVNGMDKLNPFVQLKNIEMALNCAAVASKIGCKKLLCAGTIAERGIESLHNISYTNGAMMYGVAKHAAHMMIETYCKNIGLDYVWMQLSNIYGPTNKTGNIVSYTLQHLLEEKEAVFGPALQPYDLILVDDAVEAMLRLGEKKTSRHFYFIGSGQPRILKDYLLEIGRQCDRQELIILGARQDDGIVYKMDMFKTDELVNEIGNYVSKSFTEGINYTIRGY